MQLSMLARSALAVVLAAASQVALADGEGQVSGATAIAMAPPAQQQAVAPGVAAATTPVSEINPAGIPFSAGMYQCELNRRVHVRSVTPDLEFAVLNWDKKDYTLRAVGTRSGALRYEDNASGLVLLVILGKSMLLDTKRGQQLANECKT
ncbi:MAG TPA: hypothetical protein VN324_12585 [Quisquiliibacterium sp.]|nr:hypothetical protein [Quisquiliibacterium sp.]